MQHRGGVEVLDVEWRSNPCLGCFTLRKISGTNSTEGWLEPTSGRLGNREEQASCSHHISKDELPICIESLHRLCYPGTYWRKPGSKLPKKYVISPDNFLIILRAPWRIVSWIFSRRFCLLHPWQDVLQCMKNQLGIDIWWCKFTAEFI
jgi:hypothetical protein